MQTTGKDSPLEENWDYAHGMYRADKLNNDTLLYSKGKKTQNVVVPRQGKFYNHR